jgi:murein DD-endopeptidase MepM/ murein hydrolase activator NlpD
MADAIDMKKLIHIIAAPLLVAAVLSGVPVKAHGVLTTATEKRAVLAMATEKPIAARLEKHGRTAAKHTAAKRRAGGYKVSSSRKTARTTMSARSGRVSHVARNASHKVSKNYVPTGGFGQQKGSLPWPVDSRKVIMHFGLQNYNVRSAVNPTVNTTDSADVDYVKIDNLGIVIETGKGAIVKAVMDGVVDDVMDIGGGVAVLVKHDNYFFVYSDLSAAIVTRGQQVTAGAILGEVGDEGQLDFRMYDVSDVWLDPEKWLESPALKKR